LEWSGKRNRQVVFESFNLLLFPYFILFKNLATVLISLEQVDIQLFQVPYVYTSEGRGGGEERASTLWQEWSM
jgi:hypothetical protein